jgi:hypothetical protein
MASDRVVRASLLLTVYARHLTTSVGFRPLTVGAIPGAGTIDAATVDEPLAMV